ncbi:MAG TPA: STAS domain-containing protein [Candidatus Baltobacteraceae bacterium]
MDGIIIARLDGEIDVNSKAELRAKLEPLISAKIAIVDLREVTYMDSSALTELLLLRRKRDGSDPDGNLQAMRLIVGNSPARRVLQLSGFDKVFPMYDTLEEAGVHE